MREPRSSSPPCLRSRPAHGCWTTAAAPAGSPLARIADAGAEDYDAILSNPPLHEGIAEDHAMLDRLVADAPSHLIPGGLLQIVVQRRVPRERRLAKHFASTETVDASRFALTR